MINLFIRNFISIIIIIYCEGPGNTEKYLRGETDDFRILALFDMQTCIQNYYIYVNKTDKLYSKGDYYLSVLYESKEMSKRIIARIRDYNENYIFQNHSCPVTPFVYKDMNLTDVTDCILKNELNQVEMQSIIASPFVVLCDRTPRIRQCRTNTAIRVRICEFTYLEKSQSFCWSPNSPIMRNKCYSMNEYELDPILPDQFIRICSLNIKMTKALQELEDKFSSEQNSLIVEISEWISFLTSIISLVFMFLTLLAYFVFRKLRNIPGWNVINLTLALTIAQLSFLVGSYVKNIAVVCFVTALSIHYGYLVSFFWMNVIAFDLYRNFCQKRSHVLLQSLNIKDRIVKYALYAWISPFLIVAAALIVDLMIDETYTDAQFRPCYASYLNGCKFQDIIPMYAANNNSVSFNNSNNNNKKKQSNNEQPHPLNCNLKVKNIIDYFLPKACWIQNGRANLIFFGLPIGLIILVNAIFYVVTIFNIQKAKSSQKKMSGDEAMRRFSRFKLPSDGQAKFFIQMATILGFQWISGFIMTTILNQQIIIEYILVFIFILSNASTGIFIFFSFIFKANIKALLLQKFKRSSSNRVYNRNSKSITFANGNHLAMLTNELAFHKIDNNPIVSVSGNLSVDNTRFNENNFFFSNKA